jgi:hypothetical protein
VKLKIWKGNPANLETLFLTKGRDNKRLTLVWSISP